METTVFGIKHCDTMKKALRWLEEHHIDHVFHDYKKQGVPEQRLRQWIAALGWETVINRRGTTWRKLDETLRESMNTESALTVAMENPSIIKRPILQTDTVITAGFNPDDWQSLLK